MHQNHLTSEVVEDQESESERIIANYRVRCNKSIIKKVKVWCAGEVIVTVGVASLMKNKFQHKMQVHFEF